MNDKKIYKKMIIDFMQKQCDVLYELLKDTEFNKEMYFNSKDIDAINNWTNPEAEEVWNQIKQNIINGDTRGFLSFSCPFCIKYSSVCSDCDYKLNHGKCDCKGSDMSKINKIIENLDEFKKSNFKNTDYFLEFKFPNNWYKNVLEEIESKYESSCHNINDYKLTPNQISVLLKNNYGIVITKDNVTEIYNVLSVEQPELTLKSDSGIILFNGNNFEFTTRCPDYIRLLDGNCILPLLGVPLLEVNFAEINDNQILITDIDGMFMKTEFPKKIINKYMKIKPRVQKFNCENKNNNIIEVVYTTENQLCVYKLIRSGKLYNRNEFEELINLIKQSLDNLKKLLLQELHDLKIKINTVKL